MSANSYGEVFKWTSFGESHGPAIGVVIEGCPSGLEFDLELLEKNLARRRPGQVTADGKVLVSERNEADQPQIMSGVFEGKTLGTPIAIRIDNKDQRPQDYEKIKNQSRIGHADDVWKKKFSHVDYRGGGRASARETAARVIAGSVGQMICKALVPEAEIYAFIKNLGPLALTSDELSKVNKQTVDNSPLGFPSSTANQAALELLEKAKEEGESFGGQILFRCQSFPAGLGQPVFKKLKSELAQAFMSINACAGVELGDGFAASTKPGTELHQSMENPSYGGIRGGLSTGETIEMSLAFKATSSIKDTAKQGRHDPCILPRAIPVVEAMAWAVMTDHLLWSRLDNLKNHLQL